MYYVYRRERLDPEELAEHFSPTVAKGLAEREKYTLAGDRGQLYEEGSLEGMARSFAQGLTIPSRHIPVIELQEEGVAIRLQEEPLADTLTYAPPGPISIRKKVSPLSTGGGREVRTSAYRNFPLNGDEIQTFEQALIAEFRALRKR